jgi:aminopeptidase N
MNKFEFPGSKAHYPPLLPFTIERMLLKIQPDFNSKKLTDCIEELDIMALRDINEVELDIAEIKVHEISSSPDIVECYDDDNDLHKKDKLIIKFSKSLPKQNRLHLIIKYSAGHYFGNDGAHQPRSGFYFIGSNGESSIQQAWTQGETVESRYWFPCVDHPLLKFPREIRVKAPENFIVVSNGKQQEDGKENESVWIEEIPNPAYLTSVVIGEFKKEQEDYCQYGDDGKEKIIPLSYYWPTNISIDIDPMLTFRDTPKMIKFFEDYLGTKYPFIKYAQVAVDKFEFVGMENTSATTLDATRLHDKKASLDYTNDGLIAHELAHQWFGDLVTCKDWQHIWLNEGFANYCEALYWNHSRGIDEFQYYVMRAADRYLEEAINKYKRPIVTKVYKHPDDVFDRHAYEKGGCVLHMLRNYIGEENFQKSLKMYLKMYEYKAAETQELCKVFEEVSGISLQQFFDQWLYRAGHPELDIELSIESEGEESNKVNIRIIQTDEDEAFLFPEEFPFEVKYKEKYEKSPRLIRFPITGKVTEHTFKIPKGKTIEWFSIDPEFKILKRIKSIKSPNLNLMGMLLNQLKNGETVIDRIEAARTLKRNYSADAVCALKDEILRKNNFWGVSVEAANTLGAYYDKNDYIKSNTAYEALKECLIHSTKIEDPQTKSRIRRAIIRNIGLFERTDSIPLLEPILELDQSYFVQESATTSIGKSTKNSSKNEKERIIEKLKLAARTNNTFQNILAQGAINGLKEFWNDPDDQIVENISKFLIYKIDKNEDYFKRAAAASALGKFLLSKDKKWNKDVFENIIKLLKDDRRRIKVNACTAFTDPDAKVSRPDDELLDVINKLTSVAEHDVDGWVRRAAEESINKIREWIKEWSDKPQKIDIKMREKEEEEGVAIRERPAMREDEKERAEKERAEKEHEEKTLQLIRDRIEYY